MEEPYNNRWRMGQGRRRWWNGTNVWWWYYDGYQGNGSRGGDCNDAQHQRPVSGGTTGQGGRGDGAQHRPTSAITATFSGTVAVVGAVLVTFIFAVHIDCAINVAFDIVRADAFNFSIVAAIYFLRTYNVVRADNVSGTFGVSADDVGTVQFSIASACV